MYVLEFDHESDDWGAATYYHDNDRLLVFSFKPDAEAFAERLASESYARDLAKYEERLAQYEAESEALKIAREAIEATNPTLKASLIALRTLYEPKMPVREVLWRVTEVNYR